MRDAQDVDVLDRDTPVSGFRPLRLAVLTALVVVIADQLTKRWALDALIPGSCNQPDACIDLFAGIKFHLVFNTGAAFTTGSGFGPVLAILAFGMSGFLLYLASRRRDRLGVVLFGAVAGGAIGNLLDRIFRADDGPLSGAVVDFIDVGWWPVFNVADSAIVVGVIAIIIMSLLEGPPEDSAEAGAPEAGAPDVADASSNRDAAAGSAESESAGDAETGDDVEATEGGVADSTAEDGDVDLNADPAPRPDARDKARSTTAAADDATG